MAATFDEIDFPGEEEAKAYDFLGFEERDEIDAADEAAIYALVTGTARPGTIRPVTVTRLG